MQTSLRVIKKKAVDKLGSDSINRKHAIGYCFTEETVVLFKKNSFESIFFVIFIGWMNLIPILSRFYEN